MKKILSALVCLFILMGCNTMQGFGKDVKKVGESVENAGKK